jgi:SAM-dependent methyltransferase
MFGTATMLAGQGHAASIANQTRYHRRITPARTAKRMIACHEATAKRAARRVNDMYHRLNCRVRHSICSRMSRSLTDRPALMRNRRRAGDMADLFLHHAAIDEVEDRLSMVNKSFNAPLIISGFPRLWQSRFDDAVHIGDEETLNAVEGAHDLVIHALCLHWADDPVGQLIQARRALKPDGLFLGVFFGGQTLHELRSALAQAESDLRGGLSPRVAPMGEIRDLGGLLQRAGFALPVADSFTLTASYGDPLRLMRDLRAMGETSALAARPRNFMRRDVLMRACNLYVQTHGDSLGRVPASFEFITLTGWSPADSQPQPLRPGSAATRLAEALGTRESTLKD